MLVAKVKSIKGFRSLAGHRVKYPMYWVTYSVVRDGVPEHDGERLVQAVDELEVYKKFPAVIIERHGVDKVEWLCEVNDG